MEMFVFLNPSFNWRPGVTTKPYRWTNVSLSVHLYEASSGSITMVTYAALLSCSEGQVIVKIRDKGTACCPISSLENGCIWVIVNAMD